MSAGDSPHGLAESSHDPPRGRDGRPFQVRGRDGILDRMSPLEPQVSRTAFLDTRESFDAFAKAWEAGQLPKAGWTHEAHVAMGACYVIRYGEAAVAELRQGIKRHNAAVGTLDTSTSGYHETLTCFWTGVVSRLVKGLSDPWLAARRAVETVGHARDLHRLYYSFDVVRDAKARASFVPADLEGPY